MAAARTDDTTSDMRPSAGTGALGTLAVSVLVGLVLGGLTAVGQQHLPEALRSAANSSGTWVVVAFAVALLARWLGWAVAAGAVTLLALLAGYVLTNELRGFPSSSGLLLFWGVAGVTVGPLVGLGAHWLRTRTDARAALGVGGLAGVLVGEGVYGLTVVVETTAPEYWWGSVVVGVAVVLGAAVLRLRGVLPRVLRR